MIGDGTWCFMSGARIGRSGWGRLGLALLGQFAGEDEIVLCIQVLMLFFWMRPKK
jgi:hypothetical protein